MSTLLKSTSTDGMILIPAGPFVMGDSNGGEFERPEREVWLDEYWIDETPVTNDQFRRFVDATGHVTQAEIVGSAWGHDGRDFASIPGLTWKTYAKNKDDSPVVLVDFHDACAYAAWVGKRLPTEAEWEKAARGGLVGKLYPWGDEEVDGSQCNFARQFEFGIIPTTPVKTFAPNNFGVYDSVGNVWQWCQDWFDGDSYQVCTSTNPSGAKSGTHKVRRGGSWNVIQPFRLRCANRGAFAPEQVAANVGFRCCYSR